MTTLTKIVQDFNVTTSIVAPTLRARSLVISARKLKPFTTIHIFLSEDVVDSIFVPCNKIVVTASNKFKSYDGSDKSNDKLSERTVAGISYNVLDHGEVITCSTGSAVVIADETIYNKNTSANERVLYVSNIKGTLSGTLSGSLSLSTATFVSNTAGILETNSLGNLYGVLNIPKNTYKSGSHKVIVSDSTMPAIDSAATYAMDSYISSGTINTFTRNIVTEQTEYTLTKNYITQDVLQPTTVNNYVTEHVAQNVFETQAEWMAKQPDYERGG